LGNVRTFIAVELSEDVRSQAVRLIDRLARSDAKVKWVGPENMHLTVKFLGDVPEEQIASVCAAVGDAVRASAPFEAELRGAGAFPNAARARTIWLGVGTGTDQLVQMHASLDKALRALGFPREGRKYHPHLTLGRVRGRGRPPAGLADQLRENSDFLAGTASIDEAVVFSSDLTPQGPVYRALGRLTLGPTS
jgi:2'-5' RNA ligase